MKEPKYYTEMQPYFPSDIEGRIQEIKQELKELRNLKNSNRLTVEDHEDCSDNYQMNLEWEYAISELTDELDCLKYHQFITKQDYSGYKSVQLDREKSGFGM